MNVEIFWRFFSKLKKLQSWKITKLWKKTGGCTNEQLSNFDAPNETRLLQASEAATFRMLQKLFNFKILNNQELFPTYLLHKTLTTSIVEISKDTYIERSWQPSVVSNSERM